MYWKSSNWSQMYTKIGYIFLGLFFISIWAVAYSTSLIKPFINNMIYEYVRKRFGYTSRCCLCYTCNVNEAINKIKRIDNVILKAMY